MERADRMEGEAIEAGDLSASRKLYSNAGNPRLLDLLDVNVGALLDVGCGAGDNARIVRARFPEIEIFGITHSREEAKTAAQVMTLCAVADVEGELAGELAGRKFDVLLFSHVLEHLRDPAQVVARFMDLLRPGGQVLIAVPNVLSWRTRLKFLAGDFRYEKFGVLDDTHLRFFTFLTASDFLLSQSPALVALRQEADGSFPLWWLRRRVLPASIASRIDRWACRRWPNLFGSQVLISARKP